MKAEKKQFSNRMGAAVLLLALACVKCHEAGKRELSGCADDALLWWRRTL